jgi:hypothetical protein
MTGGRKGLSPDALRVGECYAACAMSVEDRFKDFLINLNLTVAQQADGATKYKSVVDCLNSNYYGGAAGNHLLVGSWGKATRVRVQRDVDVLFQIPYAVYQRFEGRAGNKQSQLLQEVKAVLLKRFPNTDVKGDGPVVVVVFASFKVEVVPGIKLTDGQFWIPLTEGEGRYKTFDPVAEQEHMTRASDHSLQKARHLTRMLKVWRAVRNVPIRKFALELLAIEFLSGWEHRACTMAYYDYMVRDFMAFLLGRAWTTVAVPGTGELLHIGNDWNSRAVTAYTAARDACQYEADNLPYSALAEWQKIFGGQIAV